MEESNTPVIYLAGPGVFRPDAEDHALWLLEQCRIRNLRGMCPFDVEEQHPAYRADSLFHQNLERIERSQIVMADLNLFRGSEPDSGTSFELGYAYARGKKLYGYLDDMRPQTERLGEADENGYRVEDFNLPINLMLGVPVTLIQGGPEQCLDLIVQQLLRNRLKNRRAFASL